MSLLHRGLDSLLKAGTTFVILSAYGKTPLKKDLFTTSESGKVIIFLTLFRILFGKLDQCFCWLLRLE